LVSRRVQGVRALALSTGRTGNVGSGVAAGYAVIPVIVALSDEGRIADVATALLITSAVMLTVGLLAGVDPARRALRIQPSEALKEA